MPPIKMVIALPRLQGSHLSFVLLFSSTPGFGALIVKMRPVAKITAPSISLIPQSGIWTSNHVPEETPSTIGNIRTGEKKERKDIRLRRASSDKFIPATRVVKGIRIILGSNQARLITIKIPIPKATVPWIRPPIKTTTIVTMMVMRFRSILK
jgi:hypothetical protein